MVKEEGEGDKGEGGGDIINVGHGGGEGAKAIVTRGREKVGAGMAFEFIKEGGEDLVENEASKKGTEGATLGKAFRLGEVGPGMVRAYEPAGVGSMVDKVDECL